MATRDITVTIEADGKQAVYTLKSVDQEMEELKDSGTQTGKALSKAMGDAEQSMKSAEDSMEEAADRADEMADAAERAGDSAGTNSSKMSSLSDEARNLGDALRAGDWDGVTASLGRINSIAPGLIATVGGVTAALTATGAAYAYGTAQAISFEEQMLGVKKTTGLAGQDLQDLGSDILDMAGRLGVARGELATIAETAGQLGIEGRENITAFTETVAKLSSVSELTAQEAGDQIAKLANIFDVPIQEAERLGSVMNGLSNTTTARAGQIAQGMRRAGAAGEDLGLAADQVAALNATLIDSGMESERAGTSLRNLFTMIRTEASSVASAMGVTEDRLSQMLDEDAMGTLRQYLGALREMPKQLRTIKIEETFGRENLQAVQSLVGQSDLLNEALGRSSELYKNADSLNKEFAATLGAVSKQWSKLVQNINAAAIEMSRDLLPAITDTLKGLNSLFRETEITAETFEALDKQMKSAGGAEELLGRYRELTAITGRTTEQTAELETVTKKLAQRYPNLVSQYNEAGEATGIYADKLGEVLRYRREMIRQERQKKLERLGATYDEMSRKVERYTHTINNLTQYTKQDQTRGDFSESLEQYQEKAQAAREDLDRVASTLTRLYDVSSVDKGTIAEDLGITEEAAAELLQQMQQLTKEQEKEAEASENAGEAAGDQADEFSAAEKVQRGMITSVKEAEAVLGTLQTKFKEATTSEARAEYQKLIEKVKALKTQMVAAAKGPPAAPAPEVQTPENETVQGPDVDFDEDLFDSPEGVRAELEAGLIDSIDAADDAMSDLQAAYDSATTDRARQEIQALMDKLQQHRDEMTGVKKEFVDFGPAVEKSAEQALVKFGQGIGEMMSGVSSAGDVGKQVLMTLASLAERVGKIAIGAGIAVEGIKQALTSLNPLVAIAAGVALVGLAAAVRSKLKSAAGGGGGGGRSSGGGGRTYRDRNVPGMAEGGRVLSSGMVMVGEEGPELLDLPAGAEVTPNGPTTSIMGAVQTAAARSARRRGGGPGNQQVIDELKKTRQAFQNKQFRLRGTDQVTQQERAQAELDDAGIK